MLFTLRRVLRGLQQQRGYSTAVIVTLALTIGTTTAIFSAVYAILLRPQPITRPDALVIAMLSNLTSSNAAQIGLTLGDRIHNGQASMGPD